VTRELKGTIVGLCLLLAFVVVAVVPKFMHPAFRAYESSAAFSVRTINDANVSFAKRHEPQGYAVRLDELEWRPEEKDDLRRTIDPQLARGQKNGYIFRYIPKTGAGGRIDAYEIFADPVQDAKTGKAHFFSDQTGTIRISHTGPANRSSDAIGN